MERGQDKDDDSMGYLAKVTRMARETDGFNNCLKEANNVLVHARVTVSGCKIVCAHDFSLVADNRSKDLFEAVVRERLEKVHELFQRAFSNPFRGEMKNGLGQQFEGKAREVLNVTNAR